MIVVPAMFVAKARWASVVWPIVGVLNMVVWFALGVTATVGGFLPIHYTPPSTIASDVPPDTACKPKPVPKLTWKAE